MGTAILKWIYFATPWAKTKDIILDKSKRKIKIDLYLNANHKDYTENVIKLEDDYHLENHICTNPVTISSEWLQ